MKKGDYIALEMARRFNRFAKEAGVAKSMLEIARIFHARGAMDFAEMLEEAGQKIKNFKDK